MAKSSAGVLMYRVCNGELQVLLVHPGGPFWKHKDEGAWSIPKGEYDEEDPLAAAQREFQEETGFVATGPFIPLGTVRQKSGKLVQAWAFQGDCDPGAIHSNTFRLEWPPRSGEYQEVPEVDRGEFFEIARARVKINPAQVPFLEKLQSIVSA